MLERIAELDRLVFAAVNDGWSHPTLDVFFGLFTNLGLGGVIAVLGFFGLYAFDRKDFPKNFLVLAIALLLGGLWSELLKSWIGRPRPLRDPWLGAMAAEAVKVHLFAWLDKWTIPLRPVDTNLVGRVETLHIIGAKLGWRSYPSGHAVAAFGAATALTYVYRRWCWLLFVPAALVAVSRVYVGVHYPVDVLVGAALGAINAWALLDWWRPYTALGLRRPAGFGPSSSLPDQPLVMIVAGEASADTYAARLVQAVRDQLPGARFIGVGGEQAVAAGVQALGRAKDLAIVGFTGVLTGLRSLRRIYRALLAAMDTQKPDALVCLDLPDFNLALCNQAKARGIPVLYYISPQVWAWRTKRLGIIADRVDRMVVAFPFEKELYERRGVDVRFFGHPILETITRAFADRDEARRAFGLDPQRHLLVLAPGSRRNEIKYLTPVLAAAAKMLRESNPALQFVVPVAETVDEAPLRVPFDAAGVTPVYVRGRFFDVLACADAGLITSGTATLEAALAGLPHAVVYRGHPFNIWLARRLVRVDKIGLPNIILGREAFRELIQEECTPAHLAAAAQALLEGPEGEAGRQAARQVRDRLQGGEVSPHVAAALLELIAQRPRTRAAHD